MLLKHLVLSDFRNYQNLEVYFFDGIHILHGENGAGKTNILEAIYYLALTKSFRTKTDKHLIFNKASMFRIQGEFELTQGRLFNSSIAYSLTGGKRLVVNSQKIAKFSDYIGEIPAVLLAPSDVQLSQGAPYLRRRFIDVLLCQSHKLYLHHLVQYNRSLRQRNQLLQAESLDEKLLESWDENLVTNGVEIIRKRQSTVESLSGIVREHYQSLSGKEDKVKIIYESTVKPGRDEDLENAFRRQLKKKRAREMELGVTAVGSHRDDLLFLLNGKPMKVYASQGEHKTFVIALKLAEFLYLQQQRQDSPLLLFDDIFGELDAGRIRQMLNRLSNFGQVFITTTSPNFFDKVGQISKPAHYYLVENGKVSTQAA